MWALNDTSLQLAFTDNVDKPELYDITLKLEKIQYIIIAIMFMFGIINIIKRKEGFSKNHIYLIFLFGFVFVIIFLLLSFLNLLKYIINIVYGYL